MLAKSGMALAETSLAVSAGKENITHLRQFRRTISSRMAKGTEGELLPRQKGVWYQKELNFSLIGPKIRYEFPAFWNTAMPLDRILGVGLWFVKLEDISWNWMVWQIFSILFDIPTTCLLVRSRFESNDQLHVWHACSTNMVPKGCGLTPLPGSTKAICV